MTFRKGHKPPPKPPVPVDPANSISLRTVVKLLEELLAGQKDIAAALGARKTHRHMWGRKDEGS